MSADSDQRAVVTGVIEFPARQRPAGAFTVTVLVEDVSRADAPSTIVGGARFDNPALDESAVAEFPFAVTVPAQALSGIRRLNLRVHVRELDTDQPDSDEPESSEHREVRHEPDSREHLAHSAAREHPRATVATEPIARPDVTEGDFVSTQSHPVPSDAGVSALASVRIPVQRV